MHTNVDKEIELESSLPDYCPDIARLIRVDCTPVIESADINGDKCIISGNVVCNMIYETDYKNKIKSADFVREFSHNFDLHIQNCADPIPEVAVKCIHISCKMLSPRKFIIKPRLQLQLDVFANSPVKTVDTASGDNTFYKTKEISYENKLKPYVDVFTFEEEVPLLQSEKTIGEIVYGNIYLQPPQITFSGNDAIIKSNATVKLLYEEEGSENELVSTTKIIPVNMTLSNLEVDDSDKISVTLTVTEKKLTSELDAYGENRIVKAKFAAKVRADMSEKVYETVATDMFSGYYVNQTESVTISLPAQITEYDRTFPIDTTVTPERSLLCPPFDIDITISDLKAEPAQGGVIVSGSYNISVLGRTAENLESFDFTGELNEFIPVELPDNITSVEAELFPFDYSVTMMSNGDIALRIIFNAKLKIYTEEKATIISEIINQEPLPKERETFSVIYYFPSSKDTLWSIAKRYYVNPHAIADANPEVFDENERIKDGTRMVLIKK